MLFYKLEPFGAERDNWHAAQISSILCNSNRKKGAPAIQLSEFMYRDRTTKRLDATQGFIAGMRAMAKPGKKNGKD